MVIFGDILPVTMFSSMYALLHGNMYQMLFLIKVMLLLLVVLLFVFFCFFYSPLKIQILFPTTFIFWMHGCSETLVS